MTVTQRHWQLLHNNCQRPLAKPSKTFEVVEEKQKIIWQRKWIFQYFL